MRGHQPWRTNRARALRAQPVSAQDKLWTELRARRLGGYKFVSQAPIDRYFVDFLCRDLKVIVEADGGTHSTRKEIEYDAERTAILERLGYHVFRVQNIDVYENIDWVLDALFSLLQTAKQ